MRDRGLSIERMKRGGRGMYEEGIAALLWVVFGGFWDLLCACGRGGAEGEET